MREKGFTIIELLVIVAIIGILAAIAIPYYMKYTKSAYEAVVKSNVRNTVSSIYLFIENYHANPQLSPNPCTENLTTCSLINGTNSSVISKSKGVILELTSISSCPSNSALYGFEITGRHIKLNSFSFKYNSCTGKFEESP